MRFSVHSLHYIAIAIEGTEIQEKVREARHITKVELSLIFN